jgi:hypothetical protein
MHSNMYRVAVAVVGFTVDKALCAHCFVAATHTNALKQVGLYIKRIHI